MQFAFLTFLIGQSLEGFSQWKSIIHLMLSCEAAPLQSLPLLYAKFLTVIEVHRTGLVMISLTALARVALLPSVQACPVV